MQKLEYIVIVPSELSAGLRGFTEDVTIEFKDGPAETDPDMIDHFRKALADWYDVSPHSVVTKAEYEASAQPTTETAEEMAERLSDAYSTDRYKGGWAPSIKALRKRGYNDRQIEAILRSKWTRWAGDSSEKRYGQVTSTDLLKFLDAGKYTPESKAVVDLTRETFE